MRSPFIGLIGCLLTFSSVHASPLHPIQARSATSVSGYSYSGCYTEATNGRALSGSSYYDDRMTVEKCAAACKAFTMFGVEYGRECFCGNTINAGSDITEQRECSFACTGNKAQTCGAGNRLDLYQKSAVEASGTTTAAVATISAVSTPVASRFAAKGCYTEATTGRALAGKTFVDDSMTVEVCAATCEGFTYFGVEYYHECYCGYTLRTGSVPAEVGDCNTPCTGDKTETCGGGNRLNVYEYSKASIPAMPSSTPYASEGCYTEATNSRALTGASTSSDAMSVEFCSDYCSGFAYFGVEYGRECFCGNSLQAGSVPAKDEDCNFSCAGNSAEKCGAGNRLNLYKVGGSTSSSSSVISSASSSSMSSAASTTPADTTLSMSSAALTTSVDITSSMSSAASTTPVDTTSSTSSAVFTTQADTTSSMSSAAPTTQADTTSSMSTEASTTSDITSSSTPATLTEPVSSSSSISSETSTTSTDIGLSVSSEASTIADITSSSTPVSSTESASSSSSLSSAASTTSAESTSSMSSEAPTTSDIIMSSTPTSMTESTSSSLGTPTESASFIVPSSITPSSTMPSLSMSTASSTSDSPSSASTILSTTPLLSSMSTTLSTSITSSSSMSSISSTLISSSTLSTSSSSIMSTSSTSSAPSTSSTSLMSTSSTSSRLITSSTPLSSSTSITSSSSSSITSSSSSTPAISPTSVTSSSSTSRVSSSSTTSSSMASTTTCPPQIPRAIPCDGITKFTLTSCDTTGTPSKRIRAFFGTDNRLQTSTSTSITPAIFVLKQELGGCRLSTASVRSPTSSNALAEKKSSSIGLDDNVSFTQRTSDAGNPLLSCEVDKAGLLACKVQEDKVFRNCPDTYVTFGPQNPKVASTCPEISFNAVPI